MWEFRTGHKALNSSGWCPWPQQQCWN